MQLPETTESHGDDNSMNIINEKGLFDGLAAVTTEAVQDEAERGKSLLDWMT
jgi:hypothetical protein